MKKKERVFTFKTDGELGDILDRIPNKSEFIRNAIEVALEHKCPLCHGSGSLTSAQSRHLQHFLAHHPLEKCDDCDTVHFTCPTHIQDNDHHIKKGE